LPAQSLPSMHAIPGLLGGLDKVVAACGAWLGRSRATSAA
jgi:hypothetical protein